jgi:hypothetical protein
MRLEHRGSYPPEWGILADAVERAAGERCIRCFHPKGDGLVRRVPCDDRCTHPRDTKMRVLTVHHMDGDKGNLHWWNLLALCQICHLVIQAKLIPERPYLWEHKDWFKVYAAGFYAWHYGGQRITRQEAEAQLERWLALGQPWLAQSPSPMTANG